MNFKSATPQIQNNTGLTDDQLLDCLIQFHRKGEKRRAINKFVDTYNRSTGHAVPLTYEQGKERLENYSKKMGI